MATPSKLRMPSVSKEFIYRLPALLFGLADSFGILFYWSTVGWEKVAGPLLMFYIAVVPTRFARANWWLLAVLIGAYSPTYWHRLRSLFPFDELAIADAVLLRCCSPGYRGRHRSGMHRISL